MGGWVGKRETSEPVNKMSASVEYKPKANRVFIVKLMVLGKPLSPCKTIPKWNNVRKITPPSY